MEIWPEMTEKIPLVSVCVVAYNHEKYIQECLQSIVDQKTNFDFEVIVSDDCSSDRTKAIIEGFVEKYRGVVKPYLHEKNMGAFKNFLFVHGRAQGKYVSHIDGDDCMLPGKLQSQVDRLDGNDDISFAVHAVKVIDSEQVLGANEKYPTMGSIHDLLKLGAYFVNSSVMYRRALEFPRPEDIEVVDYYLHIERASKGSIYLDRRPLGCYRIHGQGISKSEAYRERIEKCYEHAFDRALSLGVSEAIVETARLARRMSFAIASYLAGDTSAYRNKIKLQKKEVRLASLKHKVLHWTANFPWLVGIYIRLRGMKR